MHFTITSTHNPKIKNLLALEKPRERRKQGLFVVEGRKEVKLAREAGYKMGNLFFCDELISGEELKALSDGETLLIPVSREVFEKVAIRENSGGVLAVAEQKTHRLDAVRLGANPLLLVLESVEKPGNLGGILRTADAAAVDAVIICDPATDFYNPNVIRSSVGCIFTNQVASATSAEARGLVKAPPHHALQHVPEGLTALSLRRLYRAVRDRHGHRVDGAIRNLDHRRTKSNHHSHAGQSGFDECFHGGRRYHL
jgi:TrmH family RNA methyltransferase